MEIKQVNTENEEEVIAFLTKEKEDVESWSTALKNGLFRICVVNEESNEIECVFIFEGLSNSYLPRRSHSTHESLCTDYPASLVCDHDTITKSNWSQWLRNYFEVPNETYHV